MTRPIDKPISLSSGRESLRREWHTAPDGRRFRVHGSRSCECSYMSACWQGWCECGTALTKHAFEREHAEAESLDALTRTDRWRHRCRK